MTPVGGSGGVRAGDDVDGGAAEPDWSQLAAPGACSMGSGWGVGVLREGLSLVRFG